MCALDAGIAFAAVFFCCPAADEICSACTNSIASATLKVPFAMTSPFGSSNDQIVCDLSQQWLLRLFRTQVRSRADGMPGPWVYSDGTFNEDLQAVPGVVPVVHAEDAQPAPATMVYAPINHELGFGFLEKG